MAKVQIEQSRKRCKILTTIAAIFSIILCIGLFVTALFLNTKPIDGEYGNRQQIKIVAKLVANELERLNMEQLALKNSTDNFKWTKNNFDKAIKKYQRNKRICSFRLFGVRKHCQLKATKVFSLNLATHRVNKYCDY